MRNRKLIYLWVAIFMSCAALLSPAFSSDEGLRESRLNKGLKHTEPYSYILIKKAEAEPANAKNLLKEAIKYSPELPAAYFALAGASFSLSSDGLFEGMDYMIRGFEAYKKNFWWLRSIAGLAFVSFISSWVLTLFIVVLIGFFVEAPLISHDIDEDKKKALIVLSLIPISFLGPLFFLAGAILILGIYFRRVDKTAVYMSILLLMFSPFLLNITNMFLSSSSPELKAVVSVNEEKENKYAIVALKGRNDFTSLFSYGLALEREGQYEDAITAYRSLLSVSPDPRIYTNLGNCYFGIKDMASAKDFYKKAIEVKPLVSAYYNLSQVSRETLDFTKGEEYFLEAVKIDREAVSRFTTASSRNPNRFVIDETLPMSALWKYARERTQKAIKISFANPAVTFAVALALLIAFPVMNSRIQHRAYRCKRCGAVLCGQCSKEMLWGQMCSKCYKSIVKIEGIDSRERVAKLLEVQEIQKKKKNMIKVLSFLPPGIAHIYAGRIFVGSLLLWMFLSLILLILLNPLLSTGLSLFSHSWLTVPAVALVVFLYMISSVVVRRRISRWL